MSRLARLVKLRAVTMIDEGLGLLALLDDVAAALVDAGYQSPYASTPALRLRCIRAGECLEALGACSRRGRSPRGLRLNATIVTALIVLLMLETDSDTDTGEVEDTRRALHAALRELA